MSTSLILIIVAVGLLVAAGIAALVVRSKKEEEEPRISVDTASVVNREGRTAVAYNSQTYRHQSQRRYAGTGKHHRDRNGRQLPRGYYFGDDGLLYDEFDYLMDLYFWYVILDAAWAEDLIGYPQNELGNYNSDELMQDVAVANEFVEAEVVEETNTVVDDLVAEVAPETTPVAEPTPVAETVRETDPEPVTSTVDPAAEPDRITSNPAAPSYDSTPSYDDSSRSSWGGGGGGYDSGGYDSGGCDSGGGGCGGCD